MKEGRILKIIGPKNYGIIYTGSWEKYYFHQAFCGADFNKFREGNEVSFVASIVSLGAVAVDVKHLSKKGRNNG